MPPAKRKADKVREGHARLLLTGTPKTLLGQQDAAGI